ncbi:MAG: FxsA family protein [Arenicellales bacterium]
MGKLFLLFLFVPLIEIYFLIQLGNAFGAGYTIALIVFTALLGAGLVRYQGVTTLARAQGEILKQRMPAMEVMEGAMLLLAGAMLLIPGFFTDALGFLFLVPPLRQFLIKRFMQKRMLSPGDAIHSTAQEVHDANVIDVEYQDIDQDLDKKP